MGLLSRYGATGRVWKQVLFRNVDVASSGQLAVAGDLYNVDMTANAGEAVAFTTPVNPRDGQYFAVRIAVAMLGVEIEFIGPVAIPFGIRLYRDKQTFFFEYDANNAEWAMVWEEPGVSMPGFFAETRGNLNSAVITGVGILNSTNGTATARGIATGGATLATLLRTGIVSTAGAGSVIGTRDILQNVFRASQLGQGGFDCSFFIGLPVVSASERWFLGLTNDVAAPTNVNPPSLINSIGICALDGSSNVHIMTNDGVGALATVIDLGSAFPARTANAVYYLRLYNFMECLQGAGNTVGVYVQRCDVPASHEVTISADLPDIDVLLGRKVWATNNADAVSIELDFMFFRTQFFPN